MTADFSYLSALDVSASSTAEIVLHEINVEEGSPILVVSPATAENPIYFKTHLRILKQNAAAISAGNITQATLDASLEHAREVFPVCVIRGWRNVVALDGTPVQFNREECAAFLKRLPNWIFRRIHDFCATSSNFATRVDAESLAKN